MRKTTGERDKWNSEKDNERKREKGERYLDNKKEKEIERVTERVAMWEREIMWHATIVCLLKKSQSILSP